MVRQRFLVIRPTERRLPGQGKWVEGEALDPQPVITLFMKEELHDVARSLIAILIVVVLIQPSRAQGASSQPPRLSISSPDYRLLIEGEPEHDYVLEASTDLASWLSISTNRTGSGGTVQVSDPRAGQVSPRFYRAFAQDTGTPTNPPPTDVVWVDDFVPGGAVTRADGGDNSDWQWVTNNPAPYSGTRAHQSTNAAGDHWHLFVAATETLRVDAGDVLFTHIYLNPDHVPSAILVEWTDGNNWEHRAYWGAQKFFYGTEGTASRRFMGPLPPAGQWVRLEIPASLVDLEDRTLSGMGFELFDGQATWDYSGKTSSSNAPPTKPTITVTASDATAAEVGPDTGTFTIARTGSTASALTVSYSLGGSAQNGTDYQALQSLVMIPAGSRSAAVTVTPIDDTATEGNETVVFTLVQDETYLISAAGGSAIVTIADDESPSTETVWVDDAVPPGAATGAGGGDNPQWEWVTNNPAPYSGTRAHQNALASGEHYHYFAGAFPAFNVQTGDVLFAHIYLNPTNVPSTVMLQWYDGNVWDHRAYWGADRIGYGTNGTASRRFIGPLPPAGQWVRLEVPASLVGLEGQKVSGMVFDLVDGQATWDYSGKSSGSTPPPPVPTVTVAASDAAAAEAGPDSGTFTFTRSGSTDSALTVNYAADGTAQNGTDYQQLQTSVTIPAGASSAVVTVTPIDDSTIESNETVIVTISTTAAYIVGSPNTATVIIADNDQPPPPLPTATVTASDATAAEAGPNSGTFTIARTGDTASALTVNYALAGTAENGTDYQQLQTSVTIPGGSSSVTVTVTPINDSTVETNETVILTLSADAAYTVGSPDSATVTIADNDQPPPLPTVTVSATDADASESGGTGTFTVSRTGSTASSLTVRYTMRGTAQNGVDYEPKPGAVIIPAGSSSRDVTITPYNDSEVEGNETAELTLSTDADYIVGSPSAATVTIADNDNPPPPPTVTVTASDASASELGNDGEFTISRSNGIASALTVRFTLGGTATNGTDYQRIDTPVTIPAGAPSVTLRVRPIFDLIFESSETVVLRLAQDAAYTIGSSDSATVTISDF